MDSSPILLAIIVAGIIVFCNTAGNPAVIVVTLLLLSVTFAILKGFSG